MKLIRFGQPGHEKPGLFVDGKRYDVSNHIHDYDEGFFAADGFVQLRALAKQQQLPEIDVEERWASPVARPSKIICIGLNYADHASESNMQLPAEPVFF